jgi:hypothetical protein
MRKGNHDDDDSAEAVRQPEGTANLVERRRLKKSPDRRDRHLVSDGESGTSSADAESGLESQNEESDDDDDDDYDLSLSSEDSDVKVIKAPLVPDWMTWESITSKWNTIVTSRPVQQLQTNSISALTLLSPYFQTFVRSSVSVAQVVGSAALVHTQWALQITGDHVATASSAAWVRVNEQLQRYVEESIDATNQRILTNVHLTEAIVERGGSENDNDNSPVTVTISNARVVSNDLSTAAAVPLPDTPRV